MTGHDIFSKNTQKSRNLSLIVIEISSSIIIYPWGKLVKHTHTYKSLSLRCLFHLCFYFIFLVSYQSFVIAFMSRLSWSLFKNPFLLWPPSYPFILLTLSQLFPIHKYINERKKGLWDAARCKELKANEKKKEIQIYFYPFFLLVVYYITPFLYPDLSW